MGKFIYLVSKDESLHKDDGFVWIPVRAFTKEDDALTYVENNAKADSGFKSGGWMWEIYEATYDLGYKIYYHVDYIPID